MADRMRAVVVRPGREGAAEVDQVAAPRPRYDECLVRVLEVGIDGTDREILEGDYGDPPGGDDHLVIGHEALGRVEEVGADAVGLSEGDLVVPTVRRPCPQGCLNCRNGEVDFCLTGDFREHGIKGLHGFMREAFAERPEFLVRVPDGLRGLGVLLEPVSIVEKAFRQIDLIQRRLLWEPRRALITGAGSLGLLAALEARLRGLDTLLFSRGPAEGPRAEIVEAIGAEYRDSEEVELPRVVEELGAPDIVLEATGFSPLAWEVAGILAVNGVGCLLSVTEGEHREEIPSDELNNHFVLGNRVLFGAVNAHRRDFETGLDTLRRVQERWPRALDAFVTSRRPLDGAPQALAEKGHDELKAVIEVG